MRSRSYVLGGVTDSQGVFLGSIHPVEAECFLRLNAASTAQLTVSDRHPMVATILDPGVEGLRARLWLIRFTDSTVLKHRLLEGQIGNPTGSGRRHEVTIPIVDDWEWLTQIQAVPNPASPISAQGAEYAHYVGPSDTRALEAITANATRLGLPWNVAASEGLGTDGSTDLRIEPLASVAEALSRDRLRLGFARRMDELEWDVTVTREGAYPRPLTPQSGILADWKFLLQRSTRTRDIVGGAGSGAARELAVVVDAEREAAVGRVMEGFTNAQGAQAGADLAPYGRDSLRDAGKKASIVTELRETSWFRFPDTYNIGTGVVLQPIPTLAIEEVITEIAITYPRDGALSIIPKAGTANADPEARLVKHIGALTAAARRAERR